MSYSVIIVEDEKLLRDELILTIPWHSLGFEVSGWAENGIDGERIIKEKNPDLVITDIRMPGQSGLQLLERVFVPFALILTAYKDFDYVRTAMRIGAFDYLVKPVDDEELYAVLAKIAEKLKLRGSGQDGIQTNTDFFELPIESANHLVNQALALIRSNFSKQYGLQESAAELCVSESHLSRIFKENTGMTFLNYLTLYRLNESIKLMSVPQLNIAEIAEHSGFVSPGYYAKIFKKATGKAPAEFRNGIKPGN